MSGWGSSREAREEGLWGGDWGSVFVVPCVQGGLLTYSFVGIGRVVAGRCRVRTRARVRVPMCVFPSSVAWIRPFW